MDKEDLARIKSMSDEMQHIYQKYADADFQTASEAASQTEPEQEQREKEYQNIADVDIGDTKIDLRNVKVTSIVDDTFSRSDGSDGKVKKIMLKDSTGSIQLVAWDDTTEKVAFVTKKGMRIDVMGAWKCSKYQGAKQIVLGKYAQVTVTNQEVI